MREVLTMGPLAGFPMQDVRVIVYDGKHHPVDSKEVAFVAAGKRAFLDAIRKARPLVLEPIVNVQINAPAAKMGDIAGDISAKRGQISRTDSATGGMVTISGRVPLSELNNYQARLKSVTSGQGSVRDGAESLRTGAADRPAAPRRAIPARRRPGRTLSSLYKVNQ